MTKGDKLRLTINEQGVTNDEFYSSKVVTRQSLFLILCFYGYDEHHKRRNTNGDIIVKKERYERGIKEGAL